MPPDNQPTPKREPLSKREPLPKREPPPYRVPGNYDTDAEARAAKYNKELNSPPPPPRKSQEDIDEEIRRKEDKAPTTRTDMGKLFARGGMLKNPNFQRSVGTDRSTGMQMQSADRKAKGVMAGGRPLGVAKQNTNHGMLDLPVAGLNKYAGHKKGGIMRKGKRFDDGGGVREGQNANIDDDTRARAMRFVGSGGASQPAATPRATPRFTPTPKATPESDDSDAVSRNTGRRFNADTSQRYPSSMPSKKEPTGAYVGYKAKSSALGNRTPEEKEAASERVGEVLGTAASFTPLGRSVGAAKTAYRGANRAGVKAGSEAMRTAERRSKAGMESRQTENIDLPKNFGEALKKGGNVKESKKMMGKEIAFFKKKGAPKSMIKHEQAEAKTMKYAKGGSIMRSRKDIMADQMKMAPYAKGGGVRGNTGYQGKAKFENPTNGTSRAGENPKVQKRGLTEGRVVKMARGGGVESRGKTRGKMC